MEQIALTKGKQSDLNDGESIEIHYTRIYAEKILFEKKI